MKFVCFACLLLLYIASTIAKNSPVISNSPTPYQTITVSLSSRSWNENHTTFRFFLYLIRTDIHIHIYYTQPLTQTQNSDDDDDGKLFPLYTYLSLAVYYCSFHFFSSSAAFCLSFIVAYLPPRPHLKETFHTFLLLWLCIFSF